MYAAFGYIWINIITYKNHSSTSYVEGLKAREVAERMNIPQRTVESHVYLTLKYLKQKMSKNDFYML